MSSRPSFDHIDPPLPEFCKAVVLSTAGHRFALPLNAIDRIVHRNLLQRDRNIEGLFYLDQQPLNGINLAELLQSPASSSRPSAPPFFVIVQLDQKTSGIATEQPPVLMDLPLQAIHPVPAAYRPQLKGLATHMISLESPSEPSAKAVAVSPSPAANVDSIFLLDLQRVARLVDDATLQLSDPIA